MMKCVATIDPAHFSVDSDEVSDVENLWLIFFFCGMLYLHPNIICCELHSMIVMMMKMRMLMMKIQRYA